VVLDQSIELSLGVNEKPRTAPAIRGFYFVKGFSFSYFALLAFSALNFFQRSFVNLEIFALPAADIVRLRLTPLGLTSFCKDGSLNALQLSL
jgi:hypothetical protein